MHYSQEAGVHACLRGQLACLSISGRAGGLLVVLSLVLLSLSLAGLLAWLI